ncbi:casein kinase II, regulatory subunit [Gongronella butleri]|nr:casein kinase II, regulatory subunit [Gongronella butleri]
MFVDSDHDSSSKDSSLQSWVAWFCSLAGNEFYIEVPEDFMDDDFNLTGLSSQVPYYEEALEVILDLDSEEYEQDRSEGEGPASSSSTKRVSPKVLEPYAIMLYGLVHQRYLLTRNGLRFMAERYASQDFGTCPRVYCARSPVLPVGRHDHVGKEAVKLYCPSCLDLYNPPKSIYQNIDGAHFGSTYAHLLFETFPGLLPMARPHIYQPKIFGFHVSSLAPTGPSMQWLRQRPPEYIDHTDDDPDDDPQMLDDDDDDEEDQVYYEEQWQQVTFFPLPSPPPAIGVVFVPGIGGWTR